MTTTYPSEPLDAALDYAARGWPVVPIIPQRKNPWLDDWVNEATTDEDTIRGWYASKPGAGVGIATGSASGMFVVDVDVADGKAGVASLKALLVNYGLDKLPGYIARTERCGLHFYLKMPDGVDIRNSAGKLGEGLDVRGSGGQVVAPPTAGRIWVRGPLDGDLVIDAPGWLIEKLAEAPQAPPRSAIERVIGGDRADWVDEYNATHDWPTILEADGWTFHHSDDGVDYWTRPGKERRLGHSASTNYGGSDVFWAWSTTNLPWIEAERAFDKYGYMVFRDFGGDFKAAGQKLQKLGTQRGQREDPSTLVPATVKRADPETGEVVEVKNRRVVLTPASSFEVMPVHWLWRDRIPTRELTLLAGREGIGKSTIAYTMAAWITRGTMKGHYFGKPKAVIVAATEDSWNHTIVPRLMAAGADLDLVYRAEVEELDFGSTPVLFPIDLPELERVIVESGTALVIIDPLTSRLGDRDTHKDAEVRQGLEPLVAMLHKTGAAGLGLIHLNKSSGGDTLTSVMGSRAFVAVARSVLFAIKDPEDDGLRRLGIEKNNLGRSDLPVYLYRIVGMKVAKTAAGDVWTGRIEFEGEVGESISATLAAVVSGESTTAAEEAGNWLLGYFVRAGGPKASKVVIEAGRAADHSERALRKGLTLVGGRKHRDANNGPWIWHPPGDPAGQSVVGHSQAVLGTGEL